MPPEQEKATKSPLKQIRTFQGDVADALKSQSESVVSIQLKEQAKRKIEPEIDADIAHERKRVALFIIGILVLTGLGALVGWYAYNEFLNKTAPPPVEVLPNRLISSTSEVTVDATGATRESLLELIATRRSELTTPSGEVSHIVLRTGTTTPQAILTTQELFDILDTRAPGTLVRAFSPVFMLGSVSGEVESGFIMIELASFESAFGGMLNWEVSMLNEFSSLLGINREGVGASSAPVWQDIVTRNKDARAIVGENGKVVLLYSFFDNGLLIITDSTQTLDTLITRLNREKLIR